MTFNQNDDENDDLNDNVIDDGYIDQIKHDYGDDFGNDEDLNDEANYDGKDYEHEKVSNNGNIDENNDGNNDEIVGPVDHGGSTIILIRKNPQNRRRQQRDKIPLLTATKKFHQLIVKSPLRLRSDMDQSEDGQLTKEGETMTFYLD